MRYRPSFPAFRKEASDSGESASAWQYLLDHGLLPVVPQTARLSGDVVDVDWRQGAHLFFVRPGLEVPLPLFQGGLQEGRQRMNRV